MSDQQPKKPQELIIYSNLAKRLIDGRKGDKTINQYPIYGLLQFAAKVNTIWQSVKQDNLYSRWLLIRIDDQFERTQQALTQYQQTLDALANDETGLDYAPDQYEATTYPIRFSTPYAWIAMRQIKQFDTLFLRGKTLNRVGLLSSASVQQATRDQHRLIAFGFQQVVTQYQVFDLRLDEIHSDSPVARQAREVMGDYFPSKIASGEKQPAFSPQVVSK